MNRYLYWTFLLTITSSLSGFTASLAKEKVATVDFKVENSQAIPLNNLKELDLVAANKVETHQELNAIATTSLVTATLDGKLETEQEEIVEPESQLGAVPIPEKPLVAKNSLPQQPVLEPHPQTVALVKEFEGFRANAYLDTDGTPVIGYGQSKINGRKVRLGDRISPTLADRSLRNELGVIQQEILAVVKVKLTPNQLGAVTSLAYNTGVHAIKRSTLVKKINRQDYLGAANEFVRWDKGDLRGRLVRMPGLTRRRQREKQLFLSPQQPTITAFQPN